MGSKTTLNIIQMNDSHAYFNLHQELFWEGGEIVYRLAGGYARVATLVKQIRAENEGQVLFCDCGDTFHGTYPALKTQGAAMIPVLNLLGLDAMTAHWEFVYGPKIFKQRASELNFPTLAINVFDQKTKKLIFPPYCVKEISGLKIGLVGVASNIIDKTMPPSYSEGLEFSLGLKELPPIVDTLRNQEKVDLIILISHLGFPQDMKLLSEVSGIDICLSGHTHNRLYQPALQGKTLVIQSGCHGSFLGHLELDFDGKKIVNYRHRLIEVEANLSPNFEVEEIIQKVLAPYKEELSAVVGRTATALNRVTTLETTMDNFLLQVLLENTGAQLAFSNGWRFGAPIIPGEITLNDLYNIIPMNPPVSTVELTGQELLDMLEENLERTFASNPYLQMGGYVKRCLGLKVYFKIENPAGHRIQKLFIGKDEVNLSQYYTAAFVTPQGVPEKYGRNRDNRSEHIVEAMQAYLTKRSLLHAELKGTFIAV